MKYAGLKKKKKKKENESRPSRPERSSAITPHAGVLIMGLYSDTRQKQHGLLGGSQGKDIKVSAFQMEQSAFQSALANFSAAAHYGR